MRWVELRPGAAGELKSAHRPADMLLLALYKVMSSMVGWDVCTDLF